MAIHQLVQLVPSEVQEAPGGLKVRGRPQVSQCQWRAETLGFRKVEDVSDRHPLEVAIEFFSAHSSTGMVPGPKVRWLSTAYIGDPGGSHDGCYWESGVDDHGCSRLGRGPLSTYLGALSACDDRFSEARPYGQEQGPVVLRHLCDCPSW